MAEKISLELAEQLTPEQQVEQGMLCFQEQDYSGAADWFTKKLTNVGFAYCFAAAAAWAWPRTGTQPSSGTPSPPGRAM